MAHDTLVDSQAGRSTTSRFFSLATPALQLAFARRKPERPPATTMAPNEDFASWRDRVDAVIVRRAGHHLEQLLDKLPLVECHQLDMTPDEVYLWHVRRSELPAGDVYEAFDRTYA